MNEFDLIVFDCDGTLVNSEHLLKESFVRVLHEDGLEQYSTQDLVERFQGVVMAEILEVISAETGHVFCDDIPARRIALIKSMVHEYNIELAGAENLVRQALDHGKACIASNGYRQNVMFSLSHTGLKPYFPDEHIFTPEMVQNAKPAPDLFLYAAEKMGVDPCRCAVIEDSVTGVKAAVNAGMPAFGVTSANHDHDAAAAVLSAAGAEQVFSSLPDLHEFLFHN